MGNRAKIYKYKGKLLKVKQLVSGKSISPKVFNDRLRRGLTIDQALMMKPPTMKSENASKIEFYDLLETFVGESTNEIV